MLNVGIVNRASFNLSLVSKKPILPTLHSLFLVLTGVFFFLSFQSAHGQIGDCLAKEADQWRITLQPFSSARCPVLELVAGQGIRLSPEPSSNLSLDVFVYNGETNELEGKSDDDAVEPFYEWRALADGRYYIIVRNVATEGGYARIRVLPPEGTKSQGELHTPNAAVINVYYVTDRAVTGLSNKGTVYGTEPTVGDRTECGIAKVSVPRAHHMGELEGPSIWKLEFRENPEKHVMLLSTAPEERNSFFKRVTERVAQSVRREAFVFVHGFSVSFEEATRRTAQISYDLGFEGAPILYSWPSQGRIGLISYNKDGRNAELSAPHLRAFLAELAAKTGVSTIHVIAHSMGNRVVAKALTGSAETGSGSTFRIHEVVLMAPDIDATEFRKLASAMKISADRITLYASSNDAALKASEKLAGYPRAGEGGDRIVVIPGVIDTIDSSSVDTSLLGFGHSYYADNSTILSDLFHLVRGEAASVRFRLRPAQNSQGPYWVFVPASR